MGKVTVYIDGMKLARIDKYCQEHKIARSTLLTRGALSIVNSQPIERCEYCKNPSIGKFRLTVHNWDSGESVVDKYLCSFHLNKAKAESEVITL